jgi:hypothetical protein
MNVAVLLKSALKTGDAGIVDKTKTFWVLALVNAETKSGRLGGVDHPIFWFGTSNCYPRHRFSGDPATMAPYPRFVGNS